jgi:hypothetical protein
MTEKLGVACRGALLLAGVLWLGGCSEDGGSGSATEPQCASQESFPGTFAAIQEMIFERHGCTERVCHGAEAAGGLELSRSVAHQNLVDAPSVGSAWPRVLAGDRRRSFLWLKLAAKTEPGSVEIEGAPMPNGLPAISPDELEVIRLWINGGAPEHGTVAGTEELLDACLPEPEPQPIKPLEPPLPGEGVQLVMPTFHLPADVELEYCFASYYDFSDQVPAEFQDPTGTLFRFDAQEMRQDPQSHHLIVGLGDVSYADLDHPAFGAWTCKGGERAGEPCEPTDSEACGSGLCGSEPQPTFACIGFGPPPGGGLPRMLGGAQAAEAHSRFQDGVFAEMPMRGVIYWNSHAFNTTQASTTMHAWMNFHFALRQERRLIPIFDTSAIFAPNAAPYTTQTVCNDHVLPRGARLFELSSHVHSWGKRFWVTLSDGTQIYESLIYSDPVQQRYDPVLAFDSPDASERTLRYCGFFNNGVAPDGSPDPETVTRLSRMPDPSLGAGWIFPSTCTPVACAAGKVGAPCNGADDDAACDSAPGSGDGWCDACPITGGETTNTEMFILIGQYYIEP